MTDQEILGAAMAYADKHSGEGGTTDYNKLENKPQIAGTTLSGNKSLADLGIASESDLAAKQDALTAGDYIDITNDEISVNREIPSVIAEYEIKTEPMVEGQAFISVTKTVNGEVVLTQKYGSNTAGINQGINFDENIYVDYSKTASWSWTYKLRNASVDHAANYTQSWNYGSTVDYTEEFIVTDHSGDKLVIKSEMDTELADKADTDMVAADFNAGSSYTAGNYCVQDGKLYKFKNNHSGAWSSADVDEVKITGELSALKSGLIGEVASITTGVTLYKQGKFRMLVVYEAKSIIDGIIAIIPASDRPASQFVYPSMFKENNTIKAGYLQINANGNVHIRSYDDTLKDNCPVYGSYCYHII